MKEFCSKVEVRLRFGLTSRGMVCVRMVKAM